MFQGIGHGFHSTFFVVRPPGNQSFRGAIGFAAIAFFDGLITAQIIFIIGDVALGILDLSDIATDIVGEVSLLLIRIFDEFELSGAVVVVGAGLLFAVDRLHG
jgi:hypothetical protein